VPSLKNVTISPNTFNKSLNTFLNWKWNFKLKIELKMNEHFPEEQALISFAVLCPKAENTASYLY
jgi:hypothetical protein